MGKAERTVETPICQYARRRGFLVRKYHSIGVRGGPDDIFYGYGKVFLIEFKTPAGALSMSQVSEIARIREHGATVFVIDNLVEGRRAIDSMVPVV